MPKFKANDSPETPGLKLAKKVLPTSIRLTELDKKKLAYIVEWKNTSQSKDIQNYIREEYKRLKKIEKDGFVII